MRRSVVFILCIGLAACRGGVPLGGMPSATQAAQGNAKFSIAVPPGDQAPQSMSVTLVRQGTAAAPTIVNLGANQHNCTQLAGGALSCTISVAAPSGNDTFELTSFSMPNGAGLKLATSRATAVVKPLNCKKPPAQNGGKSTTVAAHV